jgi:hypothetical protein
MIEHSEAALTLERFFQSMEKKLLNFPILGKPVYAKPISCEQMDILSKYTGYAYNVRLVQMACVDEAGKPVFLETDIFRLMRSDPAVISAVSNQIVNHVFTSFDAIKN